MILLYIFGALGVFIFFSWFLIPYINRIRYWLRIRKILRKIRKNKTGDTKSKLKEMEKICINAIKEESL